MLLELLRKRRSQRRFQERPVEKDKVDLLVEAMLRSPSSRGLKPWHFVVVDDRELLAKLALAKAHGAAFTSDAPLAIVVCGESARSDVWIEDCSIASLILHLTATDLGLGSCWVQIRERSDKEGRQAAECVAQTLGLRSDLDVLAFVVIGYIQEEKEGHARDTLLFERVYHNLDGVLYD